MKGTYPRTGLTSSTARHLLEYRPDTGILLWKVSRGKATVGTPAGRVRKDGYRTIRVNQADYLSHRLAWLIYYGEWPKDMIDHIDGDPSNNRITNLRSVTYTTNQQNQRQPHKGSKTGFLGVHISRGKYRAAIRVDGKDIFLGRHNTPEEAHAAYVKAKREHHPGNTL